MNVKYLEARLGDRPIYGAREENQRGPDKEIVHGLLVALVIGRAKKAGR